MRSNVPRTSKTCTNNGDIYFFQHHVRIVDTLSIVSVIVSRCRFGGSSYSGYSVTTRLYLLYHCPRRRRRWTYQRQQQKTLTRIIIIIIGSQNYNDYHRQNDAVHVVPTRRRSFADPTVVLIIIIHGRKVQKRLHSPQSTVVFRFLKTKDAIISNRFVLGLENNYCWRTVGSIFSCWLLVDPASRYDSYVLVLL